jgi:hypothetical protein
MEVVTKLGNHRIKGFEKSTDKCSKQNPGHSVTLLQWLSTGVTSAARVLFFFYNISSSYIMETLLPSKLNTYFYQITKYKSTATGSLLTRKGAGRQQVQRIAATN